ncbi:MULTISPECIES: GtrA family protein [Pseudonocardia]|uniref:GtrA-like protein n=2 Tax=Pseudonocardia TaxID=1847 RepID=A0A1Y2MMQ4_PSEAH|nr:MULTISPECIES: GtrA family protein [Pseudonocardia]OSY36536.1 GtrA-like protein [Pseudonocardia autotrophica]TDN76284.1 putative flippase GtrA [Pseudonocardia autotrophica]BBG00267.1 hypothetical protein Pdca_14760 [Pseudonocardia autotrophica]GEC29117.1 hypothetical protein PSA01_61460 [Pseudonocardia saturnea]
MGAAAAFGAGDGTLARLRAAGRAILRFTAARPLLRQLSRYAAVGGLSTGLNATLFLLFRPWLAAVPANLIALVLTTALSTELSRRFAFGGPPAFRLREWVQDVGTVAFYACYSSVVLVVLHALAAAPTPTEEATALVLASLGGGLLRFAVLRFWVFDLRQDRGDDATPPGGDPRCSAISPPST